MTDDDFRQRFLESVRAETRRAEDLRQDAIEAVRAAASKALEREVSRAEAMRMLAVGIINPAVEDATTARERKAMAAQARRDTILAEVNRLTAGGKGRAAAMIAARKFAEDSRDETEVASLADEIRRWRRRA
jgi:hypothetical protein